MTNKELLDILEYRTKVRLEETKSYLERYKLSDLENEDQTWFKSVLKGKTPLDICCGDFALTESVGVDLALKLGNIFGYAIITGDDLHCIETNSQEAVVSNYMDTFASPIKVLREWHRVLKPEGILAISVPNSDSYTEESPLSNRNRHSLFNRQQLFWYLERVQFKNIEVEQCKNRLRAKGVK